MYPRYYISEDEYYKQLNPSESFRKDCECGKEKHGFHSHLDYCPCYDKEKDGNGKMGF